MIRQIHNGTEWDYAYSSFLHDFVINYDFDRMLVDSEPDFFLDIPKERYCTLACAVHYWCKVMCLGIPDCVFKEKYIMSIPVIKGNKDYLDKYCPSEFKYHNIFMRTNEVLVI